MSRKTLLLHVFETTYNKENWFAPLKDAVDGISAEQAAWRPDGVATNTIWENVNHLIYYKERLVARMEGREWNNIDGNDTFSLTEQSNDNLEWKKVIERAEKAYHEFRQLVINLSDVELAQDSLDSKLLDIMLHDAYHIGQIIQLRKMQGSWPALR